MQSLSSTHRGVRRNVAFTAGLALAVLLAPSVAQAQTATDAFSCRSSAVRVEFADPLALPTLEPFTANAANRPCVDDTFSVVPESSVGPVTAGVVEGSTDQTPDTLRTTAGTRPGDSATASSRVTNVQVGQPPQVIGAVVLAANATVTCQSGQPVMAGSSRVVGLTLGGTTIALPAEDQPFQLDVPGVGTLYLNQELRTPDSITRRALFLDSVNPLVPDVVVAEAVADFAGNPCAVIPAGGPGAIGGPGAPGGSGEDGRPGTARLTTSPRSVAQLAAAGRCIARRSYVAVVTGRSIRSVTFSLNGRRLKTDRRSPFNARVRTPRPGARYRLVARVVFNRASGTAPRRLGLTTRRCRGGVSPQLTG